MTEILTQRQAGASSELDIVYLDLGCGRRASMPYRTAFEISQNVRVAAKAALQWDGAPAADHRDIVIDEQDGEDLTPHPSYRRSHLPFNLRHWRVFVEGSLIGVELNEQVFKMGAEDALKVAGWLRTVARRAKAWAGDRAKVTRTVGHLTDAEHNYKIGAH